MTNFIALKGSFLDIFQRQQGKNPIIKEVDGLRFIAIMAVLISHFSMQISKQNGLDETFIYSTPFPTFLELCGYGVNIFFFISAFILAIPFIQYHLYNGEKVVLKNYYLRRLRRLELPYFLVLVVLLLFRIIIQHEFWKDELPHFLSSVFYSHNIVYGRRSTINPVAWTLEIEIQFYVLLPIILQLFRLKNNLQRRSLIIIILLLWNFIYKYNYSFFEAQHLRFSIVAYMPVFLTGILVADYYSSLKVKAFSKFWYLDIATIVGFYLVLYQSDEFVWYKQWLEYVGYLLLFIGVFKGKISNYLFTRKTTIAIGVMCYSIYLLHYSIIVFVAEKISKKLFTYQYYKDLVIQSIIIIPAVILICSIFYLLIEKPLARHQSQQNNF